jgi:hypothetical protein
LISSGFEADGTDEAVEIVDNSLIEAIELGSLLGLESGVGGNRTEQAGGERRIDALEELQEDEANRVSVWRESRSRDQRDIKGEALGSRASDIMNFSITVKRIAVSCGVRHQCCLFRG